MGEKLQALLVTRQKRVQKTVMRRCEDHRRLSTLISSDGNSTPKQDAISSTTDVHLPSLYSSPAGTPSHQYSPVPYSYNMSYCPAFYPPQPTPHNQFIYCNVYVGCNPSPSTGSSTTTIQQL